MVDTFSGIVAELSNPVAADIRFLFHFCYGDANHKHAIEPTDMADMVEMANALSRKIKRPIDFNLYARTAQPRRQRIFCASPAPPFCTPVSNTKVILGLVHYTDEVDGAERPN